MARAIRGWPGSANGPEHSQAIHGSATGPEHIPRATTTASHGAVNLAIVTAHDGSQWG